jgi:hypothetical protein
LRSRLAAQQQREIDPANRHCTSGHLILLLIPQDETSTADAASAKRQAGIFCSVIHVADCSVPIRLRLPPKCQLDQNVITDLQLAA